MSKINQIENRLRELDPGAFQKLCDAYLHKKGYEQINSLGSVAGSDKIRTGTPDTFVPLPNGKYMFAEYTAQQQGLYAKFESDLAKCFDEGRSGIPTAKIQEIVLCHTGRLDAAQHDSFSMKCQDAGVNLNVCGLSVIAHDLYQKYPGLARDFLQVEVDTGQILSQDEFVRAYDSNKIATPLRTTFRFRQEEIATAVSILEAGDLLVVTGHAGVGKSRFALECCTRFAATHSDYAVHCILNRGPDLFEDLRVHFSGPGKYLLLVDDANRISRFEYVVQLLQSKGEQIAIKVVATVRDYAVPKIRERSLPCGGAAELELKPFDDEQVRQLVSDEYGITNPHYLTRIANVARGNARLAIMAAIIACRENTLKSISDVTALYDEYYRSIRADLEILGNLSLLKVAALVAFFRHIDRTNTTLMGEVTRAFGISEKDFWQAATALHDMEILDMYENEVVRISDQVLGTYLFYLSFFRYKTLDFGVLLAAFFPELKSRLIDALHPVLSAFDSETIIDIMRPHVDRRWASFKSNNDRDGLLQLMSTFWFVKETDTLAHLRDWIEEMKPEPLAMSKVVFKPASGGGGHSVLSVLGAFRCSNDTNRRIAVGLLLDYARKRPSTVPEILHTLTETYGFHYGDALQGFRVQQAVVRVLWGHAQGGDELLARVFLVVAEDYLKTYFSPIESSGAKSFTVTQFTLPATPEVKAIRRRLWEGVFSLHEYPGLQEEVIQLIRKQKYSSYRASRELVADDAQRVLAFIKSCLDPGVYSHCAVVQDYLGFLQECEVSFDAPLRDRFQNETWRVAKILMESWHDEEGTKLTYEASQQEKKQRLAEFFKAYDFPDVQRLIEQCREIESEAEGGHDDWLFKDGMKMVFCTLADRDFDLYVRVVKHYLEAHDPLGLDPFPLVQALVKHAGPDPTCELLTTLGYAKTGWMGAFFQSLESEDITKDYLQRLLGFYGDAEPGALPCGVVFLLKYRTVEREIFPRIAKTILERKTQEPKCAYALSMLFNPFTEANKRLVEVFAGDLGTLKKAYIAVLATKGHDDCGGQSLSRILDADPGFLVEYADTQYQDAQYPGPYADTPDHTFLWKRDDYKILGTQLIEHVYDCERDRGRYYHGYLRTFIKGDDDAKVETAVAEKQDEVLRELINCRYNETEFMEFLFGLIAEFGPERRRPLLAHFLAMNKSFEVFERLPLEPSGWSWTGSAVPMHQKRVEYMESLLPLLDTAELLRHKQLVERHVQGLRTQIERAKRSDFIDND
jgi:hypothetical protein